MPTKRSSAPWFLKTDRIEVFAKAMAETLAIARSCGAMSKSAPSPENSRPGLTKFD